MTEKFYQQIRDTATHCPIRSPVFCHKNIVFEKVMKFNLCDSCFVFIHMQLWTFSFLFTQTLLITLHDYFTTCCSCGMLEQKMR